MATRGPEPAYGLENPGAVDAVRVPAAGPVELVPSALGPWTGDERRQILLQEKVNRFNTEAGADERDEARGQQ